MAASQSVLPAASAPLLPKDKVSIEALEGAADRDEANGDFAKAEAERLAAAKRHDDKAEQLKRAGNLHGAASEHMKAADDLLQAIEDELHDKKKHHRLADQLALLAMAEGQEDEAEEDEARAQLADAKGGGEGESAGAMRAAQWNAAAGHASVAHNGIHAAPPQYQSYQHDAPVYEAPRSAAGGPGCCVIL